jgi:membrane protein YdbS with pleckstrin-like domain
MDTINKQYEKLGYKTLIAFILKKSALIWLILLLIAIASSALGWSFVPDDYILITQLVVVGLTVALVIVALIIFLLGWLEYRHYKIFITDETIKIFRGLVTEEELGLPFRRVKESNIERNLLDQIFGISNIRLTVLGEDDSNTKNNEDKLFLPALDKNIAQEIQDIILKKAEVEQINVDPSK